MQSQKDGLQLVREEAGSSVLLRMRILRSVDSWRRTL